MHRSKVRLVKILNKHTLSIASKKSNKPSIVWLDRNVNEKIEDEFIPRKLAELISYKKRFYSVHDCWNYIEQLTHDEKIILIININCGQGFISWINNLVQILAIYVYGIYSIENEQSMMNSVEKIMNVTSTACELFPKIIHNLEHKNEIVNKRSISKEIQNSRRNLDGDIIFMQNFIQTLLNITPTPFDRRDLIAITRKLFPIYGFDMETLDDFERNYTAYNVIDWYTQEGIFYRILNEALQSHDIIVLYMLRLFIIDLYRELDFLKNRTISKPKKLFRAQFITKQALKNMQQAIGESIYMNNFLSTSSQENIAKLFIPNEDSFEQKGLVSVLLEIDIDSHLPTNSIVDIHEKSSIPEEDEFLIMLGSIFHITNIHKNKDDIHWTIQLKLSGEEENQELIIEKQTDLFSIGKLLYNMDKSYEAEQFYYQLLKEIDSNDILSKAQCYKSLSALFILKGDNESGNSFLEMAIFTFQQIPKHKIYIADSYKSLANCYTLTHKNTKAEEYYEKTLEIYIRIYGGNHMNTALIYLNMGALKTQTKNYNDAVIYCLKALNFFKKQFSINQRYIAHCYYNLGVIYCQLGQYDLALFYLEKQLKIQHKILPVDHPEIGTTYLNIGEIYEKLNFYKIALYYYEQTSEIFHSAALLSDHGLMKQLKQHIQSTKKKLEAKNKLINDLLMLNK